MEIIVKDKFLDLKPTKHKVGGWYENKVIYDKFVSKDYIGAKLDIVYKDDSSK